jgi:hypothetical protein
MNARIATLLLAAAAACGASTAVLAQADPAAPAPAAAPGGAKLSRLQGKASLGRNRAVVGATVLVRPLGGDARLFVTASDSRGGFRIDDLPDGDYSVEVRREGLVSVVKKDIDLRYPFRSVIELTMQPAGAAQPADAPPGDAPAPIDPRATVAVDGRVVESGGEPMAGAVLRLVRNDGDVDPRMVRSADDGTFRVDDLPAGSWRLQARVVGYLTIWTDLVLRDDTELTVSMVPQPPGYEPSPLELMPAEQPVPPESYSIEWRTAK